MCISFHDNNMKETEIYILCDDGFADTKEKHLLWITPLQKLISCLSELVSNECCNERILINHLIILYCFQNNLVHFTLEFRIFCLKINNQINYDAVTSTHLLLQRSKGDCEKNMLERYQNSTGFYAMVVSLKKKPNRTYSANLQITFVIC